MGPLAVFLGVAFAGSTAASIAVAITGGHGSPHVGAAGISAMLAPALAVLATRLATGARVPDSGWRLPWRWLPAALFLIPAAVHAVALPATFVAEGRLPWLDWLTPAADGLFHTPADRGWGDLTAAGLLARIALNAVVGLVAISVLAFFEEIGWRAFLLPRLVERRGERAGALLAAAIWALWHVPFALSGVHHIDQISPAALVSIAPLGHIGAGLVLAWLWLRTRSIVLVSLAHGALNNWGQYAFKLMNTSGDHDTLLLAVINGTLLCLGVAVWLRLRPEARTV
jgi:membrane protease YdiL (CAAX protease family)